MAFKYFGLLTNRVILGMVAFFVLVGLWQFRWKPQYRPLYEVGVADYQAGRYPEALEQFQRAYEIAPNSLDVILMLGWAHFKVNHFEDARFFFDRALRINPRTEEAQLGAAFVALETGRGTLDVDLIREYLGNREGDPGVRILSAGALAKDGRLFEAAAIYRGLTEDKDYGEASRLALVEMFGLAGTSDTAPTAFPPLTKPETLDVRFRANDGALWRRNGDEWRKFYVAGVNLGAAPPGYFPSIQPNDAADYGAWLDRAASLNANVIRVYNLLPPAFYRAFAKHAAAGGPLTLFQQIWVGDPPNFDLFDSGFMEQTRADIRHVVDAINGRAEVPPGRGLKGGVYDQNVAPHVGAILFGRELEPSVVVQTNVLNAGERSYRGRYIQIADATATEVWVATMLDYLVHYETTTYNRQHPVAFVNWPPLDPLFHPTEATTLQEFRFRIARGEQLELPSGPQNDADVVAVDEARFTVEEPLRAGLFASYHVYPHWPDFLLHEPGLLASRDREGPNPVYGYLRQLRERLPHPLVVSEYGVSNARGVSHLHPLGWNHGGHTEAEQAQLLARLARTVLEAGTAGGMVFSLHDEWYKHNWLVRNFEVPSDRATLWLNDLNPDERFGLVGFRAGKWRLFAGDPSAWRTETTLYTGTARAAPSADPFEGARTLRSLQAAADEAYVYLRLTLGCLDCAPKERRPDSRPRFDKAAYAITINTRPGSFGVQTLPFGNLTIPTGANFLLLLTEPSAARLLVSDNYNPYEIVPTPGVASDTNHVYRVSMDPALQPRGSFVELIVEPNVRRFTKEGSVLPPLRYSWSTLRYGIDNPDDADDDSLGDWHADLGAGTIVVRIPWAKLLVTDPSGHNVFAGFEGRRAKPETTPGLEVAAFAFTPSEDPSSQNVGTWLLASSLPALQGGTVSGLQRLTWERWETVKPEPYLKRAYGELQRLFAEQTGKAENPSAPQPSAARQGRAQPADPKGSAASAQVRPAVR